MDHLWSPWRYQYIQKEYDASVCVFCLKPGENKDAENFVVHRGEHNFIILNLYPYSTGHMMVVPYRHVDTLEAVSDDTASEMMLLARTAQHHLGAIYRPAGFNIGMNIGESAGAGIAGHIHLHVLPRWAGDSNFMTTVAETRVLPEDLSVTYQKLREAFAK